LPTSDELLSRRERLPPRRLPLLYFGFAYLSLATAFAAFAFAPASLLGFFYHPRLLFVVHLLTLGWITASILGALHLVGPMALSTPMPARRRDYWIFAFYVFGSTGVIFHFLVEEFSGLGLSGLIVAGCVGEVGWKALRPLASAPRVPGAVKLHFALAFANFLAAAAMGVLLAFHKLWPFLPGYILSNVYAHVHMAALGWATMTVFAAAYRLLPMFLPSAMPGGFSLYLTGAVFEAGVLGLFVTLLLRSPWEKGFAVVTALGIAGFFAHVVVMKLRPRPAPRGLPRPDLGVAQALLALAYLLASTVLGLYLAFAETTETTLKLAAVYGVAALVGFLAQMVVGISGRLLPVYSWLAAYSEATAEDPTPPANTPHELVDRRLQALSFALWAIGVPLLAAGFYTDGEALASAAGWLLLTAVVAGAASYATLWRDAWGPLGGDRGGAQGPKATSG